MGLIDQMKYDWTLARRVRKAGEDVYATAANMARASSLTETQALEVLREAIPQLGQALVEAYEGERRKAAERSA